MAMKMDTPPTKKNNHAMEILVVDDSLDSINLMSAVLDYYKCSVTTAFDGQDSVNILMNKHFDLVVLDWQMPQMGGKETLLLMDRLLSNKRGNGHNKTPVIIYTAHGEEDISIPFLQNFLFLGVIDKHQPFSTILRSFGFILNSHYEKQS